MSHLLSKVLAAAVFSSSVLLGAPEGISLVGKGLVPGSELDKSGLSGDNCQASDIANCVPQAILGGFGSGLTYTGHDNVYIAAPDRGPFDGLTDVPYIDRFHFFHMTTEVGAPFPNIEPLLLDTRFLRNESGQEFLGGAGEFDLRFDPEGIRVGPHGTFFISDEYGPFIKEFNRQGHLVRRIEVPEKFAIANPSGDPTVELLGNTSGRQGNRGMEGLAITPDGRTLYGIMQNALLQDAGLNPGTTDRLGINGRILKVNLSTGATHEYVYQVEAINRGQGVSEILAINDHEFLVVERDNRSWLSASPQAPTRKKIWKVDVTGATDVSGIEALPAGALPTGVTAVSKVLFIDLLDPVFGLNLNDTNAIAEKIEALSWGPDLRNGDHLLYVLSDNDLNPGLASQIFSFSIAPTLINLQPQFLPMPLYPKGHVKKCMPRKKRR